MTAKDKAKELFDNYYIICQEYTEEIQCNIQAKQCALIAVEEVRFFHDSLFYATEGSLFDDYLNKVKHEIEQL
jgi:hypothetical protein